VYGVFKPGGAVASPPLALETVFEGRGIALLKKPGCRRGRLSTRDDQVLYLFGDIYNLQEVWPTSDGSEDELSLLHELVRSPQLLDLLPRLNGSFLIVAYDSREDRLRLISDRYGSQKCYYAFRDGCFHFFPHIHYFQALGFPARIDRDFLVQFLTFRHILGKRTILDDVFLVPNGSVIEVSRDGLDTHTYWAWRFDESREHLDDDDLDEATRELGDVLIQAVERRLAGKSRVLLPLSGGYDSRALLGAALECRPANSIHTVTYGTPGTFDYELGSLVAGAVGTVHRQIDLTTPRDYEKEYARQAVGSDGMVDLFHQVFLSDWEKLPAVSDDIMTGFMGDVLMGGTLRRRFLGKRSEADTEAADAAIAKRYRWVRPEIVSRLCRMDVDLCRQLGRQAVTECNQDNPHRLLGNYLPCWNFPNRQAKLIVQHAVKLREDFNYLFPFLDRDFVDFAVRIPVELRWQQKLYKRMLADRFPRLFALPVGRLDGWPLRRSRWNRLRQKWARSVRKRLEAWTGGAIPAVRRHKEWLRRKRINYLDFPRLLRRPTPFQAMCLAKLRRLVDRDVLDGDCIMALWSEHGSGKANRTHALLVLVGLEFIYEAFIDH